MTRYLLTLSFAMGLAVGCRPSSPSRPETPKAGVPAVEMDVMKRQYRVDETPCRPTAEEVVDIQRRCSRERWADCLYAGAMYFSGCGVAKNMPEAESLYRRACSFGSMIGCEMQARFEKDPEQALTLLEVPCARGYATACGHIGFVLYGRSREADVPRAAQLLKAACHDDRVSYCLYWGKLVIQWKLASEYQDAQAQLDRACRAKEQNSCELLASAYDQGLLGVTDVEQALAIYAASCDADHPPSCDAKGHMYVLGRGQEKDEQKGVDLFFSLCAAGYGPSCNSMGQAVGEGWGAPPSPAEALPFYERACSMGCEPGCQRSRELGMKH